MFCSLLFKYLESSIVIFDTLFYVLRDTFKVDRFELIKRIFLFSDARAGVFQLCLELDCRKFQQNITWVIYITQSNIKITNIFTFIWP